MVASVIDLIDYPPLPPSHGKKYSMTRRAFMSGSMETDRAKRGLCTPTQQMKSFTASRVHARFTFAISQAKR